MARPRRPSAQTRDVLELLAEDAGRWRHGYELTRDTGIASGTLYPLLMRLTDRGYLESRWKQAVGPPGRPPRHLYRLTTTGRKYAAQAIRSGSTRVAPRAVRGNA